MIEINWIGPMFDQLGYARHNREMIWALDRQGIKVNAIPTDGYRPYYFDKLKKYLRQYEKEKLVSIYCIPTTSHRDAPVYGILLHTIESRMPHPGLVHRTLMFEESWVPCYFNLKAMRKAVKGAIPVYRIPEGIDPEFWYPRKVQKNKKFTFICVADWSFRKGVHELATAYKLEFKPEEAELHFVTKYQQSFNAPVHRHRVKQECIEFAGNLDGIRFFFANYTDEQLAEMYSRSHVFVLPSKGEAWCLPACEAMACGIPCILPKIGGHRDFFDERSGWLTKGYWGKLERLFGDSVDFYIGQDFYLPDINDLRKKMRYAYENREEIEEKGAFATEHIRANFTWDKAGEIAAKRIREIYKKPFKVFKRGKKIW